MTDHLMHIPIDPHAKALIFDLDGTLADTMPAHREAWVKAANFFGAPMTEEMVQAWAGMASYKIVGMLNEKFQLKMDPVQVSQKKAAFFFEIQGTGIRPIDPIFEIAKKYKDVLPLGIGTGSRRPNAIKILEGLNALTWFQSIVSADDVVHHKPAPDTYLKCANELGVHPTDCVVFEDADFGIQAARDAGMKVIDIRAYL